MAHEINQTLTVTGNHVQVTMTKPEGMRLALSLSCSTIESYNGRLTIRGAVNATVISFARAFAKSNGEARL